MKQTKLKCPRCKSKLLTNGSLVWCSNVGSKDEYACLYGIDTKVFFSKETPESVFPMY